MPLKLTTRTLYYVGLAMVGTLLFEVAALEPFLCVSQCVCKLNGHIMDAIALKNRREVIIYLFFLRF